MRANFAQIGRIALLNHIPRPHIYNPYSNRTIHSSPSPREKPEEIDTNSSEGKFTHISFEDTENIFASKSTAELLRAFAVFEICKFKSLVKYSDKLIDFAYGRFPGKRFTNQVLRATFFGHFCGGEDFKEIQPVIRELQAAGIGAILDYAAEEDVQCPRDLNGVPQKLVTARTYDYENESTCDANAEIAKVAIISAGRSIREGESAFAAIKCTALGKPELLLRMSSIIVQAQLLFLNLDAPNLSRPKSQYLKRLIDYGTLSAGFKNAGSQMNEHEIKALFHDMDKNSNDGHIDFVDWVSFVDPIDLTMGPITEFIQENPLDEREKQQLRAMINRLEKLAAEAVKHNVKLMIDAEQTYMQPGIDHLVLNLQRKYNKNGQDLIYNTFQCYLKSSSDRIDIDLERARRENFKFACKLVRGAYLVQERKRAKDLGYPDPIHDSIDDTHFNYNTQVSKLLEANRLASFMVASHNEDSVRYTIQRMKELEIDRKGPKIIDGKVGGGVYFGQLFGMCDHVSYMLGLSGYQVFKYLPYGPIEEVIPYLIRRAQENAGLLGASEKELLLLKKELRRRFT
uniref:Proline dehydrogenase n=1 Tax=Albugo laibachii Nc14 TaxID=890382 RepID=F0WNW4_9STRA|nr:proline oxidase putative [Albugo laibachii Nc14]|eukprot:CCA23007.1 proline oxidase putative [Albugo laibachii Nc14]